MEIDVMRYLDDDTVHRIVEEEFRSSVRERMTRRDVRDLVGSVAKDLVWDMVDTIMSGFEQAVANRVVEVIGDLDRYDVFHGAGQYTKESRGHELLEQAVDDHRGAIARRVDEIVDGLDANALRESVEDAVFTEVRRWISEGEANG